MWPNTRPSDGDEPCPQAFFLVSFKILFWLQHCSTAELLRVATRSSESTSPYKPQGVEEWARSLVSQHVTHIYIQYYLHYMHKTTPHPLHTLPNRNDHSWIEIQSTNPYVSFNPSFHGITCQLIEEEQFSIICLCCHIKAQLKWHATTYAPKPTSVSSRLHDSTTKPQSVQSHTRCSDC